MPYRSSLCLMASMVREKEISPVDLVRSHLDQIESCNPSLNAFVEIYADQALEQAHRAEEAVMRGDSLGLLHGIPVTVKDSFDVAGRPTLCGSRLRAGHRAADDSGVVARMRSEGAILLGKTNCPEFLRCWETDNNVTGRTNHPRDASRTPGGSSGGEAAAIASFCSAGGVGSDAGGSVRIPAHFCGIAGLKPTPGRVSIAGHFPAAQHPGGIIAAGGPMARSAQDVRLLFAALAGYDEEDPFSAPVPLSIPETNGTRIGLVSNLPIPVHPEILQAAKAAAATLESAGFPVESFVPKSYERAAGLWWFIFGRLPNQACRAMVAGHEDQVHWSATELLLDEPPPTSEDVLAVFAARDAIRAAILRDMQDIAVLVMPPCGTTAFPHRARQYDAGAGRTIGLLEAMAPVTFWNLLGFPAITVPLVTSSEGFPIGVQLVARPYEEELLLEVAVRLEEAQGALVQSLLK